MKDFKNYRKYELKYYVFANIIFLLLTRQRTKNIVEIFENTSFLENINKILCFSIVSIVTYIIIFVFDSLIPGNAKWRMVYWFLPEPSEIVFIDIRDNDNDNRFTSTQLQKKCRKIYRRLDECDNRKDKYRMSKRKWHSIYLKYENEEKIKAAKRDYIITRDLYISTIFIILCCLFIGVIGFDIRIPKSYYLLTAVEFLILKIAVRARGTRLCRTVLATHVSKKV